MRSSRLSRRSFLRSASLSTAGAVLAACAGEPQIVEKIVQETVIVEKVVEKVFTSTTEQETASEKK